VQINRYHLVRSLAEAVEREIQQLQVQARSELAERVDRSHREAGR
jgi:hypothetical protein